MRRTLTALLLAGLVALAGAGPALAWDQCTQVRVQGPDGVTRSCDWCCRGRQCQLICY